MLENQPISSFQQNPAEFVEHLHQTQTPITLLLNGQPAAVIQDPAAYQRLLDLAALGSAEEGIRQGLADLEAGRTRPTREVFADFRQKHGI